jgi:hypothetical protein
VLRCRILYSHVSSLFYHLLEIHAHYFEDGNVQLQSMREFPSLQISYGSDAEFSTVVQAHIKVFLSPLVSNQIRCDILVASSVIAKRSIQTTSYLFHVTHLL